MAGTVVKAVGSPTSTRKSKATPFRLSKIDQSYLVFCDTCSLMADKASYALIDGVGKTIEQHKLKLIIAKRVIDELYKHQANKTDSVLSKKAIGGLKIIQTLQNKGLCDIFEDKNDPFADQLFLSLFTKFRKSHNLLMITNDNNLAYDLLGLTQQKSVQSNKRIEVCFIGVDGDLIQYKSQSQITHSAEKKSNSVGTATLPKPKFSVSKTLKAKYTERPCKDIPEVGGVVFTDTGAKCKLEKKIAEGGEGSTYITDKGHVCKIYRKDRLTDDRYQKLLLMTANQINHEGICWPEQIVYNSHKEFLGYLMPKAKGIELQKCVFLPWFYNSICSKWKHENLVKLALSILEKIEVLHNNNVLIGDINPMNIMVESDDKVYLIDTDSYQIDGYPCPVGTVNFTAPEIQGKDFKRFLRTLEHEKFAVATLLFMILFTGKSPYSQLGGESPGENIRKHDFSYPLGEESNKKAPKGQWRFIWSHLHYHVKEAFYNSFRNNQRLDTGKWIEIFRKYLYDIRNGLHSNEVFPKNYRIVNPVEVTCSKCSANFTSSKNVLESLSQDGKKPLCESCREAIKNRVAIQVSCDICYKQFSSTKDFVETLATEGKKPLCESCREAIKNRVGSRNSAYSARTTPINQPMSRPQPASQSPRPTITSSQSQSSTQPTYRSQTPIPQIPPRVQPVSQTANTNQNSSSSTSKKGSGSGCLVSIGTFVFTIILIYVIQILI